MTILQGGDEAKFCRGKKVGAGVPARKTVEVPQLQFIVYIPVVAQRQIPMVQTVQKTMEIPQLQYIDKVVDVPVSA